MSTLLAAMALCTSLEAEPLATRVARLAKGHELQLVYSTYVLEGLQAPPICFQTVDEAFTASLREYARDITHEWINEHTLTIVPCRFAPARCSPPPRSASITNVPPAKKADRLELATTQVTGNRELPKVMFIVPWKRAEIGDPPGKPTSAVMEDLLQPVDRDVFEREIRYGEALER